MMAFAPAGSCSKFISSIVCNARPLQNYNDLTSKKEAGTLVLTRGFWG